MNTDVGVVLMCAGMFLITFFFGYAPTKITTSQKLMNLIAIYGAGLLVGAALIVIVPEGMMVLSSSLLKKKVEELESDKGADSSKHEADGTRDLADFSQLDPNLPNYVGASLVIGFAIMLILDQGFLAIKEYKMSQEKQKQKNEGQDVFSSSSTDKGTPTNANTKLTGKSTRASSGKKNNQNHNYDEEYTQPLIEKEAKEGEDNQDKIVVVPVPGKDSKEDSLILKEKTQSALAESPFFVGNIKNPKREISFDLTDLQGIGHDKEKLDQFKQALQQQHFHLHQTEGQLHAHEHYHGEPENILISTIGLVAHSFADGLALGTSLFLSSHSENAEGLGLLIFLAILLHKAPASIGLGTFLHHEGLRKWELAAHLFAFTITSPIAAIASYFSLKLLNIQGDGNALMFWVGILLLVSAGSFIYVATIHILPEVFCNTEIHRSHIHTFTPEDHAHEEDHFAKWVELGVIVLGLCTPFLLMLINDE